MNHRLRRTIRRPPAPPPPPPPLVFASLAAPCPASLERGLPPESGEPVAWPGWPAKVRRGPVAPATSPIFCPGGRCASATAQRGRCRHGPLARLAVRGRPGGGPASCRSARVEPARRPAVPGVGVNLPTGSRRGEASSPRCSPPPPSPGWGGLTRGGRPRRGGRHRVPTPRLRTSSPNPARVARASHARGGCGYALRGLPTRENHGDRRGRGLRAVARFGSSVVRARGRPGPPVKCQTSVRFHALRPGNAYSGAVPSVAPSTNGEVHVPS